MKIHTFLYDHYYINCIYLACPLEKSLIYTTHKIVAKSHHLYMYADIAQYHTWLLSKVPNSQPIYLVSFLPGYPLLNFGIVTALYIFISHRLFTLTAILRDAIIPHDNDPLLLKNLITIGIAVAALWGGGFLAVQLADAI